VNGWLVFIDESGLLLLPLVRRTWSRRGQTPVLRHRGGNLKKVSAIAALCVSPDRRKVRLYFQLLVDANFNSVAVLGFLKQLARHFRNPLLLIWDRSKIHRGLHTQVFLDVMDWWQFYFPPTPPSSIRSNTCGATSRPSRWSISLAPMSIASPSAAAATHAPYSTHPACCTPSSATVRFLYAFSRTLLLQESIVHAAKRPFPLGLRSRRSSGCRLFNERTGISARSRTSGDTPSQRTPKPAAPDCSHYH
jgi:hypothetical protein